MSEFILVQIALTTLIALITSVVVGSLSTSVCLLSLLISTVLSAMITRPKNNFIQEVKQSKLYSKIFYGLIGYIFFYQFAYLLYSNGKSWMTLHKNNYGDLPLHIHFIKYLVHAQYWPEIPILSGNPMSYPFAMDFYNALFEKIGIITKTHLFIVGFVLSLILVRQLYKLGSHFLVWSLVFGGGLTFFNFFTTFDVKDFAQDASWKNLILSVWITQRGFLFALPSGLVLLRYLYTIIKIRDLNQSEFLIFVILWGVLPLFHVHSFLILSLIILSYLFVYKKMRSHLKLIFYTFILAAPIFGQLLSLQSTAGSFVHWKWGWDKKVDESFWMFWIQNWGLYFVLLILSTIFVVKNKSQKMFDCFYVLALFLLFNGVQLAPWSWDNIKIIIWIFILLCLLIQDLFIAQQKNRFMIGLIFLFCGASGILSHLSTYFGQNETAIYEIKDLNATQELIADLPNNALFLCAPTHNSELSYFGQMIEMGYAGHMWSLGLNDRLKSHAIQSLMEGDCDQLKSLRFEYLLWGPKEVQLWKEMPSCLSSQLSLLKTSKTSSIFKRQQ